MTSPLIWLFWMVLLTIMLALMCLGVILIEILKTTFPLIPTQRMSGFGGLVPPKPSLLLLFMIILIPLTLNPLLGMDGIVFGG